MTERGFREDLRLALYGGTFDPVHNAHLAVAQAARQAFALDRVLLVPNAIPPHKQRLLAASYEHRLRMVELAVAGLPGLEASNLEQAEQTSYSILTIEKVRAAEPDCELFFLIGADAFADIETWFRWREVVERVTFLVVGRPGFSYDVPVGAKTLPLTSLALTTSSSAIRKQLASGAGSPEIPAAVERYIAEHGLYRERTPKAAGG